MPITHNLYHDHPELVPPWTMGKLDELEQAIQTIRRGELQHRSQRNKYMYHRIIALHPMFVQDMSFPELTRDHAVSLCVMYHFPTLSLLETTINTAFKQGKIVITDSSEWTGRCLQQLQLPYLLVYPRTVSDDFPPIDLDALRRRPCCQHLEVEDLIAYQRLVPCYDPVRGLTLV